MLRYIKLFWKENLAASLFLCGHVLMSVFFSFAFMRTTDYMIAGDLNRMLVFILLQIFVWLLGSVSWYLGNVLEGKAHRKMNNAVRADISAMLVGMPHEEYRDNQIGDYISWYNNDVRQISILGFNSFYAMVSAVFQTLLSAVSLLMIHWVLSAAAILLAVLLTAVSRRFDPSVTGRAKAMSTAYETFCSDMKDILSGFPVMKNFRILPKFTARADAASDKLGGSQFDYTLVQCRCNGTIMFLNALCKVAITAISALLIVQKLVPVGAIVGVGSLTGMVFDGLTDILRLRTTMVGAQPYLDKFARQTAPANSNPAPPPIRQEIRLRDLSFSYGTAAVLDRLNLTFRIGGKYAIVGPSGSGKSTLLKLLLGQLDGYEGRIELDGQDLARYAAEDLSIQMAYIEQETFLFNTTIRDNITLWAPCSEQALDEALENSALAGDLDQMENGMDTQVGEGGKNLSGGQRQRVAIARALLHQKSILLVDEATSALDKKNADLVEDRLLNNPGLTLILISHHLDESKQGRFDGVYHIEKAAGE